MKIINKQGCFVQISDLECIVYNDPYLSCSLYSKMANLINSRKKGKYIRIDDKEVLDYISSCDFIVSFEDLKSKNNVELENMINTINRITSDLNSCVYDDIKSIIACQKEIKYNSYLLNQYDELLSAKTNNQNSNLPDIIDDSVECVSNDCFRAYRTLSNKVIVYPSNDVKINKLDKDFCNEAYLILMDKYDGFGEGEELNCTLLCNNGGVILELVNRKENNKKLSLTNRK